MQQLQPGEPSDPETLTYSFYFGAGSLIRPV